MSYEEEDDGTPGPEYFDKLGQEVPAQLATEVFCYCEDYRKLRKRLTGCIASIQKLSKKPAGKLIESGPLCRYLKLAIDKLHEAEPYATCPYCKAQDPLCKQCNGDGWVTRMSYETQAKYGTKKK